MKEKSNKQLYSELKRNVHAEMKLEEESAMTSSQIERLKKARNRIAELQKELAERLGMDEVPSAESEKLRARMTELGLDHDLDWMFGDGSWC